MFINTVSIKAGILPCYTEFQIPQRPRNGLLALSIRGEM